MRHVYVYINCFQRMYKTEGASAIASITELRMETAEVLSVLENVPAVCIQRNNTPEAAVLSMARTGR